MSWKIALPMYRLSPELEQAYDALAEHLVGVLRAAGWRVAIELEHAPHLPHFWQHPDLLFSQTCGYPYMTRLREHVTLLATPRFDFPGCAGSDYASALVVRADGRIAALPDALGRVAAANDTLSNSGMNALRHAVAPFSRDGRFFSAVTWSGSHMASLALVRSGAADIAAIDCVTWAYLRQYQPASLDGLTVLQYSAPAPGLPLVAGLRVPPELAALLREALLAPDAALAALLALLGIAGFDDAAQLDYGRVMRMEAQALAFGYGSLG